ncbi:hypothetical protein BDZ91DRAFT_735769 [Kalaharituber pfeilii]|nr:hypothetical protein BDZ91DRAFT_735769 [Kalaharituber pfeilii]
MEPSVDINHVEPILDSGMIFTANEDNLTEEMADAHLNDPNAYKRSDGFGVAGTSIATYGNYKFLT